MATATSPMMSQVGVPPSLAGLVGPGAAEAAAVAPGAAGAPGAADATAPPGADPVQADGTGPGGAGCGPYFGLGVASTLSNQAVLKAVMS
jgi:hypothetical protein